MVGRHKLQADLQGLLPQQQQRQRRQQQQEEEEQASSSSSSICGRSEEDTGAGGEGRADEEGRLQQQWQPYCCVATRNSHGADIEHFLLAAGVAVARTHSSTDADENENEEEEEEEEEEESNGAVAPMPVHCVNAEGRSKADVALQLLAEGSSSASGGDASSSSSSGDDSVVVMVDDDLRELVMDKRLLGGRVHRVFFSPRELS